MDKGENTKRAGLRYLQNDLPDEMLRGIFAYLFEIDLCHAAQVCKRFARVTDDQTLWRNLYGNVYEYDRPVRILNQLEFIEPDKDKNHWRDSFISMYQAVHVRPGYCEKYKTHPRRYMGRRIQWYDTVQTAVESCKQHLQIGRSPLLLVHAGNHKLESRIELDFPLQLVGAAPGRKIADSVIIDNKNKKAGLKITNCHGYIGHLTLSMYKLIRSYPAMTITKDSSLIVDSCTILAQAMHQTTVDISGANPHIIRCTLSNGNIYIRYAEAVFEDNKIMCNESFTYLHINGIHVNNSHLIFRRNHVYESCISIIDSKCNLEENHIEKSISTGIYISYASVVNVQSCHIHDSNEDGIYVLESEVIIENSHIHSNQEFGVHVFKGHGAMQIRINNIHDNKMGGLNIHNEHNLSLNRPCTTLITGNKIHHNSLSGLVVESCGNDLEMTNNEVTENDGPSALNIEKYCPQSKLIIQNNVLTPHAHQSTQHDHYDAPCSKVSCSIIINNKCIHNEKKIIHVIADNSIWYGGESGSGLQVEDEILLQQILLSNRMLDSPTTEHYKQQQLPEQASLSRKGKR